MTYIGKPERNTQNRVIDLFRDELGYRYPGNWTDRNGNSNIAEGLLTAWLTRCGYSTAQINSALEAKLAKARQVKQGMMQELLIGKVRLV